MSAVSKHFGLKYKEESYIFKELERIRQETKKDLLQFQQKLAPKPAVDEASVCGLQAPGPAAPGEKGSAAYDGPPKPSGSPRAKGSTTQPAALLQRAPRGAVRPPAPSQEAAPGKTRRFRPQDFYVRSSAFLRHPLPKKPPVIASRAGTSRPLVLMPPPAARERPGARLGGRSPRPTGLKPVPHPGRERSVKEGTTPPAAAGQAKPRTRSSISSREGHAEAAGRRRRARAHTHSWSRASASRPLGAVSESQWRSIRLGRSREAAQPVRVIPTSIEEIIASLQSEAQLASDQTIKKLIQSVLGENYDLKMEDISLMGKVYWHKPSQEQAEQGLQINLEEPQMNMLEELPKAISSIFQLEQEDMLEWGVSEAGSTVCKSQETLEVRPADESSKSLKDEQLTGDSRAAKQASLKNSARLPLSNPS